MEFLVPVLLKEIMTLKFEPQYLPDWAAGLTDALNTDIGAFNEDTKTANDKQRHARAAIDQADGEFFASFEEMANRIHASLLKALETANVGEDEADDVAESLFEHVKEILVDALYSYTHSGIEFEFEFDPGTVSIEFWEPSTC